MYQSFLISPFVFFSFNCYLRNTLKKSSTCTFFEAYAGGHVLRDRWRHNCVTTGASVPSRAYLTLTGLKHICSGKTKSLENHLTPSSHQSVEAKGYAEQHCLHVPLLKATLVSRVGLCHGNH